MSEHEILVPAADFEPRSDLDALQSRALIVGGLATALIAVGYFTSTPVDFLRAYLVGWLTCLCLALGLFAVGMLGHISGGDWGVVLRRVSEASGRTLPFFAVAAIPIALGLDTLYPWADPVAHGYGAHDHLIEHKSIYLNKSGFIFRGALYFVIWTVLAYLSSGWSRRHDETGDESYKLKMKKLSVLGLVLHILICTFASVDWIMSLDPHWFSSLFGLVFVAGQALSAFAFAVVAVLFLAGRQPMSDVLGIRARLKLFHDYGKMMLAGVMFWSYLMISQYLIIWSADLPEEIAWYIDRSTHGWQILSLVLILGHFALPFVLLLSQDLKKKPALLALVALWVLTMRWFDFYWQVAPSLHSESAGLAWLEPVVPIGLGGLWLGFLVMTLKSRSVVPTREPALKEIFAHG